MCSIRGPGIEGSTTHWIGRRGPTPNPILRSKSSAHAPLNVAPEIVEDTNEVAIQIGGHKLAQLPRFVLGLGNDLRLRGLPLGEELVHLSLAVEIEPEKDWAYVAVGLSEGAIGDKQSAIPP